MIVLISGTFKIKHYNKTFSLFHTKFVEVQYLEHKKIYKIVMFKNERKEYNKASTMILNPLTMRFFTIMSRKNTFVCCNSKTNLLFLTQSTTVLYNCLSVLSKIQRNYYEINEEFKRKKEENTVINIIQFQSTPQSPIMSIYKGGNLHSSRDKHNEFDNIKSPCLCPKCKSKTKNTCWTIMNDINNNDNKNSIEIDHTKFDTNKFFFNSKMTRLSLNL
mmetsp:Transcript_70964/g.87049  ORF Transcript_70964/g.87049 Transcript_70964/m.87049 type:complete len:218 (+) Transcript_70964:124-777(+)